MWLDDIFAADHPCDDQVLERCVQAAPIGSLKLECGVFRGASLRRLCAAIGPGRAVWGFDTFTGLPEDWRPPFLKGAFACAPPDRLPGNARLIVGDVSETLPRFLRENKKWVGFCHLDLDVYSSTRDALAAIEMRLYPGSILLFDEILDASGRTCNAEHEQRAFREFIDRTGYVFEFFGRRHEEAFAFRMVR